MDTGVLSSSFKRQKISSKSVEPRTSPRTRTPARTTRASSPSQISNKRQKQKVDDLLEKITGKSSNPVLFDLNFKNDPRKLAEFNEKFRNVVVKAGRVIHIDQFKKENFRYFQNLEYQGWIEFLRTKCDCYPQLVKLFYANATVETSDDCEERFILSEVKGKKIKIDCETLETIFELQSGGDEVHEVELSDATITDTTLHPKLGTGKLGFEDRLLYLIVSCGVRQMRVGSSELNEEDCFFMGAIKQNHKLRLSSFIISDMVKIIGREVKTFYYGMVLTRILQHFEVDFKGEECRKIDKKSDVRPLSAKKMGYELDSEGKWVKRKDSEKGTEIQGEAEKKSDSERRSKHKHDTMKMPLHLKLEFTGVMAKLIEKVGDLENFMKGAVSALDQKMDELSSKVHYVAKEVEDIKYHFAIDSTSPNRANPFEEPPSDSTSSDSTPSNTIHLPDLSRRK